MRAVPNLKDIRALALDVDGVLTDGTFWWGPGGEEFKRFSFRDVMGLARSQKAGLRVALISGEDTPLLDRYADKLGIARIYRGCKDKGAALRDFAAQESLPLTAICFIGDDVNDVSALTLAGHSAAPADAHPAAKEAAAQVLGAPGGHGAVREWTDLWLARVQETAGESK